MNDVDALARLRAVRWSVLDRALTRAGQHPAETLRETVRFAQQAEELGYHRFWVAEHHGVPGIAGSAPTVLAAAVAAATSRIRVGTGGVMLPNHRPYVIAEQFGVLESLFPGRIDMGLGRSVGFTAAVRRALGTGKDAAEGFADQVAELLGHFGEPDGEGGPPAARAIPARGLRVPAFVLAVGEGAAIAARLGLPLVMAHLPDEERTLAALARYREAFTPTAHGSGPYVILAANVAVARTREEAALLQLPEAWATAHSRTRGVFPPLEPAADLLRREPTGRERAYLEQARAAHLYGGQDEMPARLARLVARTGADEVLVTLNTHDPADRLDSYRRLARLAGLAGRTDPTDRSGRAGQALTPA